MRASELMIGDNIMTPLKKGTVVGKIEEIDISFDAPYVCNITCDVGGDNVGFILDDNKGVKPIPIRVITLQELNIKDVTED